MYRLPTALLFGGFGFYFFYLAFLWFPERWVLGIVCAVVAICDAVIAALIWTDRSKQ